MRTVKLPFEVKSDPPFPLRIYKPGMEWIVELCWPEDAEGHVAVCGLFHSADHEAAMSFYLVAHRIISCWKVDTVWHNEGKVLFEMG